MNIPYGEIFRYFESVYPEEGCGLLVNKSGKLTWRSCTNKASNPLSDFAIAGLEYVKASMVGDVYAIVHSHPNVEAIPSLADKKASEFLGIKYLIVSIPSLVVDEYNPINKFKPYIGREYKKGTNDCWSLIRDYYRDELDVILPVGDHNIEDWGDNGVPFYNKTDLAACGFLMVEEPKINDIIAFSVMSKTPNHFGVYLGQNIFLHHADNRLSCREPLSGVWMKSLKGFLRCKKYI